MNDFVLDIRDEVCPLDHTPNAETIAAIEEGRAILAGKIPSQNFKSFEEIWAALDS